MKADHAFFSRNAFCGLVAFAALGSVQVAAAADSRFDAFMGRVVGNNTTVTFGGGGQPLVTSSAGLGTPSTVGNMGVGTSPAGPHLGGTSQVPLGDTGKRVAAAVKAPITGAAFGRALVAAGRIAWPIGVLVAGGEIYNYLTGPQELVSVQKNPDGSIEAQEWTKHVVAGTEWAFRSSGPWFASYASACAAAVPVMWPDGPTFRGYSYTGSEVGGGSRYCNYNGQVYMGANTWQATTTQLVLNQRFNEAIEVTLRKVDEAELLDRLAKESGWPTSAAKALAEALATPGVEVQTGTPTVTGPSTVPGTKTQTTTQTKVHPGTTTEAAPGTTTQTQPATRTTTTTTTHNVTYNNNVVTYNTTTVNNTTTTNNVTGQTDTTTDQTQTEDDSNAEDKPDMCEKNPKAAACQEIDLDTPEGDIPKSTADVTYQIENSWGSGSCPSSVFANINGRSVMVYDWPQTCSYVATYVRPLLLLMCALGALFIVMPGKADT